MKLFHLLSLLLSLSSHASACLHMYGWITYQWIGVGGQIPRILYSEVDVSVVDNVSLSNPYAHAQKRKKPLMSTVTWPLTVCPKNHTGRFGLQLQLRLAE